MMVILDVYIISWLILAYIATAEPDFVADGAKIEIVIFAPFVIIILAVWSIYDYVREKNKVFQQCNK